MFVNTESDILLDINNSLFGRAKKFRDENSKHVSLKGEFFDYLILNMLDLHITTGVVARRSHDLSFLNKKLTKF